MGFASRRIGRADLRVSTLGFGGAPPGGLFDAVGDGEALATLEQDPAGRVVARLRRTGVSIIVGGAAQFRHSGRRPDVELRRRARP